MFKLGAGYCVLITESKWDEIPRLRHRVALMLSERYRVIYCEVYTQGRTFVRRTKEGIIVVRLGYCIKGVRRLGIIQRLFDRIQLGLLQRLLGLRDLQLIMNFQFDLNLGALSKRAKSRCLAYNDDFITLRYGAEPSTKKQIAQQRLLDFSRNYEGVVLTSELLRPDVVVSGQSDLVLYSAHDFTNFREIDGELARWNKGLLPKVVYLGPLDGNVRVDWLRRGAAEGHYTLEVIGPCPIGFQDWEEVRNLTITRSGPLFGDELLRAMCLCDVALMPYTESPVNSKATVPAKLYNYLACGLPIVASGVPNLKERSIFIHHVSTYKQFIAHIMKAWQLLTLGERALISKQYRNQSWELRTASLLSFVSSLQSDESLD